MATRAIFGWRKALVSAWTQPSGPFRCFTTFEHGQSSSVPRSQTPSWGAVLPSSDLDSKNEIQHYSSMGLLRNNLGGSPSIRSADLRLYYGSSIGATWPSQSLRYSSTATAGQLDFVGSNGKNEENACEQAKDPSPDECEQAVEGLSSAKAKAKAKQTQELQKSEETVLKRVWAKLLGIGPALGVVASMSRADWAVKLRHWKDEFKSTMQHYWLGTKLLWADVRISSRLLLKLAGGKSLSRRERQQLTRTPADIFRPVPVAVFIIVPLMEFLLPVFLKLFPNMLPSTFQDKMKEQMSDDNTYAISKMEPALQKQIRECNWQLVNDFHVQGHPDFDKQETKFKRLVKDREEGIRGLYICSRKVLLCQTLVHTPPKVRSYYVTATSDNTQEIDSIQWPESDEQHILMINIDASYESNVENSGCFSWVLRDALGVLKAKRFVSVPFIKDTGTLESLAALHAVCSVCSMLSGLPTVRIISDCKPFIVKVSTVNEELDNGLTLSRIISENVSKKAKNKPNLRAHYALAYMFTKIMKENYSPKSGLYLVCNRENQISHHFANGIRFYFQEKNNLKMEKDCGFEIKEDEEIEYLNFESVDQIVSLIKEWDESQGPKAGQAVDRFSPLFIPSRSAKEDTKEGFTVAWHGMDFLSRALPPSKQQDVFQQDDLINLLVEQCKKCKSAILEVINTAGDNEALLLEAQNVIAQMERFLAKYGGLEEDSSQH